MCSSVFMDSVVIRFRRRLLSQCGLLWVVIYWPSVLRKVLPLRQLRACMLQGVPCQRYQRSGLQAYLRARVVVLR
jgi:hypothetical protein